MNEAKYIDLIKSKKQVINEQETSKNVSKTTRKKRLSSNEFLKTFDSLWKEGPMVSYKNPEVRVREFKVQSDTKY
jgi:hypothetical protein